MKYDLEFGIEKQELMIGTMLVDESIFQRANSIIQTKYFDEEIRPAVEYIMYHSGEFNSLPTFDQIKAETGIRIPKPEFSIQDSAWGLQNIEKFCQRQAILNAVSESVPLIENGNFGEIEKLVKDAIGVSLQKDLGTNIFLNPRELMDKIRQNKTVATGWKQFDEILYGGLNKGEITIFAAGSGVGKSLVLQNLGLNWFYGTEYTLKNGDSRTFEPMHVVYISYELSEELIARRMYTMIAGIPSYEMYKRMDDLETKVAISAKKGGSFIVKYLPTGTNTNQLRAYLKEYEIQFGRKPDALLIDYMDLMAPNSSKVDVNNVYAKDKYVSEELRGLAAEYDVLMASASQLGRSSVDEADHNHSMIQGGMSKIQTCDNLVSIYCSPAMRERGEYQFQFLKTRSSAGTHRKITLMLDKDSLRLYNSDDDDDDLPYQSANDVRASLMGPEARLGVNLGSPKMPPPADDLVKANKALEKLAPKFVPPVVDNTNSDIEEPSTVSPQDRLKKILNAKNKKK